jgi:uncharacterized membrane protein
MGRPASPFIVEGEGELQAREAMGEKRKRRRKKKEKNKKKGWSTASFLFFLWVSLAVRGMEMCVIPRSCSSLEQLAFSVNPDEAPHPVTGVGEVK